MYSPPGSQSGVVNLLSPFEVVEFVTSLRPPATGVPDAHHRELSAGGCIRLVRAAA